jgi:hypothetical protein
MSRIIDGLIAWRLIKLLTTRFDRTEAYKLGIIDDKGKVLIKSKDIKDKKQRNAYTLLIRFVFNLKRMLGKIGLKSRLGSAAAAAIAFFKEQYGENPEVERQVYKYIKEQGFEFEISETYGEPLTEGTYKVKHDIYDLEGDVVINMDESIEFTETTDTIMGYDVFKHNGVYLTTEDLYV